MAGETRNPREGERPRVPPGQVVTEHWPVLHHGAVPRVDLSRWTFRTFGRVEKPFELTWEEFLALPQVTSQSDIHCVTRLAQFAVEIEQGLLALEDGIGFPAHQSAAKSASRSSRVRCLARAASVARRPSARACLRRCSSRIFSSTVPRAISL